jgi:energy-coupling factor transporter transmembrane protein EcfT
MKTNKNCGCNFLGPTYKLLVFTLQFILVFFRPGWMKVLAAFCLHRTASNSEQQTHSQCYSLYV